MSSDTHANADSAKVERTDAAPADRDRAEAERRIWRGLRDFVLDPGARKAHLASELGISFSKSRALRRLLACPLTLKQLAAALVTDAPYATLIVDDLVELGLVQRQPHPDDRRAKLVVLTPAGRDLAERAVQILDAPPTAVSGLDDVDLAALDRIVARFAQQNQAVTPSD